METRADHWRRVEAIYEEAMAQPAQERSAYLARACGATPEILREVEALLRAGATMDDFLDTPIATRLARELAAAHARHMNGQRIGPYEVQDLVGAGGMGEVYRARDTRLGREVAIKLVAPHVSGDAASASRLVREAQHASGLNHPAVCTVHDVGDHEGQPFIVMELVDGETLSARLGRGPMPVGEAVRVGRAVAAALAHAHAAGVVHGDLKSHNVMLRADGQPKVLDFGLSRRVPPQGLDESHASQATLPGFGGTTAYAAPELLRGARPDARSDVWSFGVLLYYMLSGRLPFGSNGVDTAAATFDSSPPSLPDDVPTAVQDIVARCLERERGARYASAAAVHADLAALPRVDERGVPADPGGAAAPLLARSMGLARGGLAAVSVTCVVMLNGALPHRSIPAWRATTIRNVASTSRVRLAVLPVYSLVDDPAQGDLSVAITDMLIGRLSQSPDLLMKSDGAAPGAAPSGISGTARRLGAEHVLVSRLLRGKASYRLSLQLYRAPDSLLWAKSFEVEDDRLYEMEHVAARGVLTALGLPVPSMRLARPRSREAFNHYLLGRAALSDGSESSKAVAVSSFDRALQLDPDYAPSYAGLAIAYARMHFSAGERRESADWTERAKQAAREALRRDDTLAEAHEAIAAVYRYNESDWEKVIEESTLALRLSPSLALPHTHLAVAYYHLGLFDLSELASWAGLEANPQARWAAEFNRGRAAFYNGRYIEAVGVLEQAAARNADATPWVLAEAYYYAGDPGRSERMLRALLGNTKEVTRTRAAASLAAFLAVRDQREARALLAPLQRAGVRDHHAAYRIGTAYAQLGDAAAAERWLSTAIETGFPCYAWYVRDPLLDPVRDAPGVHQVLENLRRRWQGWRDRYGDAEEAYAQAPSLGVARR